MLTHIRWGITLASVMLFYSTQSVAQSVPSATSTAPTAPQLQNASDNGSEAQTSETRSSEARSSEAQSFPQDTDPVCPAGQFASAFPDVTPNDWAYEAVNRLAIGPMRCFPDPSQS